MPIGNLGRHLINCAFTKQVHAPPRLVPLVNPVFRLECRVVVETGGANWVRYVPEALDRFETSD